jgi:hypothetical protein
VGGTPSLKITNLESKAACLFQSGCLPTADPAEQPLRLWIMSQTTAEIAQIIMIFKPNSA